MAKQAKESAERCAEFVLLHGCVQGRGVRPAIYRLARQCELAGSVANTLRGLEIVVEGSASAVALFVAQLPECLPAGTRIDRLTREPTQVQGLAEFTIARGTDEGALSTQIPADTATCSACLAEVDDPADRRHAFPLNSCAACGPRYTIIATMPYVRSNTVMQAFPLCAACQLEYQSDANRRFHAETSSCPDCGPRIWLVNQQGESIHDPRAAMAGATAALRQGRIVALRGIGGYQLLVDAGCEEAVRRLRQRKCRPAKPLAVMVADTDQAQRLARLNAAELRVLQSAANPIVLCQTRGGAALAAALNPGLSVVGLLLPTTALHALLLERLQRPLVCTSGNREGEPLEITVEAAERELSGVADVWLHHDRPIARPLDDSVVRIIADRSATIRLARGLAPFPLELPAQPETLAVGGFLKSAIAWSNGRQSVLGPHLGDHQSQANRTRFQEHVDDTQALYRFRPKRWIHDAHPDYFSTRWVESRNLPGRPTQHHHAHVVSGMLEHGWLDRTVLGICWDGTGFGSDRSIWGGEVLLTQGAHCERVGHLRPFRLPGAESAIHQPWRTALAILDQSLGRATALAAMPSQVDRRQLDSVQPIVDHPRFAPVTTSAGRLFDAASVLILGWETAAYDGQGPMMLESIADPLASGSYAFPIQPGSPFQWDWRPLFAGLWADRQRGTSPSSLAMRFHRSLAIGISAACRKFPNLPVVLSGGVFQNRLLVELVRETIDVSRPLGMPGTIPCNDGGLAAGQLAIAAISEEDQCA